MIISATVKRLKNSELHRKLVLLAALDKKNTYEVLLHISEVDRRKIYLEMAYPNLYEYLVSGLGYTPASAQRRVDGARVLSLIPEVGPKIETGALHLSQLSQFQKAQRQAYKTRSIKLSRDEKLSLLTKIENKSPQETELVLSQNLSLPISHVEKKRVQSDESVRFEMTFSKEEMDQVQQAMSLLSHASAKKGFQVGSLKDFVLFLSTKTLRQYEPRKGALLTSDSEVKCQRFKGDVANPNQISDRKSKLAPDNSKQKNVPTMLRKHLLKKSNTCEYKDPKTGRRCGARNFLEVDHIKPRWAGGLNTTNNLRILCANHNKYRYEYGR